MNLNLIIQMKVQILFKEIMIELGEEFYNLIMIQVEKMTKIKVNPRIL